jgi:hypothetical protein
MIPSKKHPPAPRQEHAPQKWVLVPQQKIYARILLVGGKKIHSSSQVYEQ